MRATKTTALLVSYDGGFVDVESGSGGRWERFVPVGGVRDEERAIKLGKELLDGVQQSVKQAGAQGVIPAQGGGATPAIGGNIVSATGDLGANGEAVMSVEVGDPARIKEALWEQSLARAAAGTTAYATPFWEERDPSQDSSTVPPEFVIEDPFTNAVSQPYRIRRPYHASWINVQCLAIGARPTTIVVMSFTSVSNLSSLEIIGEAILEKGKERKVLEVPKATAHIAAGRCIVAGITKAHPTLSHGGVSVSLIGTSI